jgi:hypothetical protein
LKNGVLQGAPFFLWLTGRDLLAPAAATFLAPAAATFLASGGHDGNFSILKHVASILPRSWRCLIGVAPRSLILVPVAEIQPRRVRAVKWLFSADRKSFAPNDLGALDSCDKHRNCLSEFCILGREPG